MADPLEAYLRRSPLTQRQRADLWDAYNGAADQDSLAAALQAIQVPKEVKAGLWDMKAGMAAAPRSRALPQLPGTSLTNAPPETLGVKVKRQLVRSATGGVFDSWDDASDWFFGSKERREASAAGLAGDPTPAQMLQGAVFAAGPAVGEIPAVAGAPAAIASAGRAMTAYPKSGAALLAALPSLAEGDLQGAAVDAAMTALGIKGAQKLPAAFRLAAALRKGASLEEAVALATGTARGPAPKGPVQTIPGYQGTSTTPSMPAPMPVPQEPIRLSVPAPAPAKPIRGTQPPEGKVKMATIHQPEGTSFSTNTESGAAAAGKVSPKSAALVDDQLRAIAEAGGEGNPLLTPQAQRAIKKPPKPAPVKVDKGREAVQIHSELRQFAREYGKSHPNERTIYIKLDSSGRPVETISQGQAGALTRKGERWTWINNIWGDPKNLHTQ